MTNHIREQIIKKYFASWIEKKSIFLPDIFAKECLYIESHGTAYEGLMQIKTWFEDWITKGEVLQFEAREFFHKENSLIVEWHFEHRFHDPANKYNYKNIPFEFDGVSLVKFNKENKIEYLREYKSDIPNLYPLS